MNEVIRVIDEPVLHHETSYLAQVCGRLRTDEMWEGWVEFIPADGGEPIHSPRETTQPDHDALSYWAAGLSNVYLEGALQRAYEAAHPRPHASVVPPAPIFEAPARRRF